MISLKNYLELNIKYEIAQKPRRQNAVVFSKLISIIRSIAQCCLSDLRYWINAKKVEARSTKICITSIELKNSTIQKVLSISKLVLLTLPGLLAHTFIWLINRNQVTRLSNFILTELENKRRIAKEFSAPRQIKVKQFTTSNEQKNCVLMIFPDMVMRHVFFPYLSDVDKVMLARSCTLMHQTIANDFRNPLVYSKKFPFQFVEAYGRHKLACLPSGSLTDEWGHTIQQFENFNDSRRLTLGMARSLISNAKEAILRQTNQKNFCKDFILTSPVQKIQSKNDSIAVKISLINHQTNAVESFLISKVKGKWMVTSSTISEGLLIFLNDIRNHTDTPIVLEYLTRLFKREPCGIFPHALNSDFSYRPIIEKASEKLIEGPRTFKYSNHEKSIIELLLFEAPDPVMVDLLKDLKML